MCNLDTNTFFFQKSEYIQNPFYKKVFVFITKIQSNKNKITFSATKLFHPLAFGILRWWANNAVTSRWPFFSNDYIWVFSSVFIISHHLIFFLVKLWCDTNDNFQMIPNLLEDKYICIDVSWLSRPLFAPL